jgi:hypothetical protein
MSPKGKKSMRGKRFWKLLLLEMIVLLGVGGYFFIDSHDVYRWWVGDTHFTTAPTSCNLHVSTCELTLSDGSLVSLDISPKPIPLMKPLNFRVLAPNLRLPFIELKLFATNMNMGFHTFKLFPKEEGVYEGEGMLPTCVVGNMIWQTNLIINQPTQSIGATFYFQTDK